jgi:hypothetical protein
MYTKEKFNLQFRYENSVERIRDQATPELLNVAGKMGGLKGNSIVWCHPIM